MGIGRGAGAMAIGLLAGALTLLPAASGSSARMQPVDDAIEEDADPVIAGDAPEDAPEDAPADFTVAEPEAASDEAQCPGDGTAVDTPAEIAEFADYAENEFFVLDDDTDCRDDDSSTGPYALPVAGPVRSPGILPLVASGAAPASDPAEVPPPEAGRAVLRSIGGRRVRDTEIPWQVQIFQPWTLAQLGEWGMTTGGKALWEFQHLCGATLVADSWALTASHCLPADAARTGYRVRLAAETIHQDGGYTYRIDRIVPFSPSARASASGVWREHDISLIHFVDDRGIGRPPAAQARPIPIDRGPPLADNAPVFATGWGRVSNRTQNPTSTMMRVQLNIVANERCARGPWGASFIHDRVLCAAAPGRQTCQGDSGGPLVNGDGPPRLIGIVSWNNADCVGDVGRQGIYTRVARYADWIERTIR